MPAKKYNTQEERLAARRESARRFYENNKHNPKYVAMRKQATQRFIDSNKEYVAARSKLYYWTNDQYRERRLTQCAEKYANDESFRERAIATALERYWKSKCQTLLKETLAHPSVEIDVFSIGTEFAVSA
jgi:hypothetical protein